MKESTYTQKKELKTNCCMQKLSTLECFFVEHLYSQDILTVHYTQYDPCFTSYNFRWNFPQFLCSKRNRFRSFIPHMNRWCNFTHFPWESNPWEHSSMNNRSITEKKITLTRGYYLILISPPFAFLNISFYERKSALSAYLHHAGKGCVRTS